MEKSEPILTTEDISFIRILKMLKYGPLFMGICYIAIGLLAFFLEHNDRFAWKASFFAGVSSILPYGFMHIYSRIIDKILKTEGKVIAHNSNIQVSPESLSEEDINTIVVFKKIIYYLLIMGIGCLVMGLITWVVDFREKLLWATLIFSGGMWVFNYYIIRAASKIIDKPLKQ